jgi:hypothetical protein
VNGEIPGTPYSLLPSSGIRITTRIRWPPPVATTERYRNMAITFVMTLAVSPLLAPAEIGV